MTTHICDLTPSEGDPESAHALLYRHGLPEDVIDGALNLHAHELAAVQRREAAVWGVDTAAGKHRLGAADLIDPTRNTGAVPAGQVPVTDQTTLSCVCGDPATPDTVHRTDGPCYAIDLRVAALAINQTAPTLDRAVLPASVDRATVLREAADAVRDGDLGPRGGMSRDYENGWWNSRAAAEDRVRRMADEAPQPGHVYLSTGCLHGEHAYCSNVDGIAGLKKPAQCKFCAAPCVCPCHAAVGAQQPKENRL